jgi:hypothetical protein
MLVTPDLYVADHSQYIFIFVAWKPFLKSQAAPK